jgi:hypothetical protein
MRKKSPLHVYGERKGFLVMNMLDEDATILWLSQTMLIQMYFTRSVAEIVGFALETCQGKSGNSPCAMVSTVIA